jgi:hypothetical protein
MEPSSQNTITKATDTHSDYVILIAFPRQQWLRERASMLLYTYIVSLVTFQYEMLPALIRATVHKSCGQCTLVAV